MTGEKNVSLGNIGQPAQCPCKLVKTSSELNFICKLWYYNHKQVSDHLYSGWSVRKTNPSTSHKLPLFSSILEWMQISQVKISSLLIIYFPCI